MTPNIIVARAFTFVLEHDFVGLQVVVLHLAGQLLQHALIDSKVQLVHCILDNHANR